MGFGWPKRSKQFDCAACYLGGDLWSCQSRSEYRVCSGTAPARNERCVPLCAAPDLYRESDRIYGSPLAPLFVATFDLLRYVSGPVYG